MGTSSSNSNCKAPLYSDSSINAQLYNRNNVRLSRINTTLKKLFIYELTQNLITVHLILNRYAI